MPRSPRLAKHRRDARLILHRHGDRVHAARDPALDDLVLLGRVETRRAVPDQLDAQLARRFFRARCGSSRSTDRLSPSASPRSPAVRSRARNARAAFRDRTSHTFVPATISAPARYRRTENRDLAILHFDFLFLSGCSFRTRADAVERDGQHQQTTPSTLRSVPKAARPDAVRSATPRARTARAPSPRIVPRPPNTDVPPSTTAVIASSS